MNKYLESKVIFFERKPTSVTHMYYDDLMIDNLNPKGLSTGGMLMKSYNI
jgi:hypothetical protein